MEALPVMAFFAIAGKAESTREAGCWSLDKKKSVSARVALPGIRQIGEAAIFSRTAELAYDPKSWALELDNEKKRNRPKRNTISVKNKKTRKPRHPGFSTLLL